jgi:hypothetical protein
MRAMTCMKPKVHADACGPALFDLTVLSASLRRVCSGMNERALKKAHLSQTCDNLMLGRRFNGLGLVAFCDITVR